MSLKGPPRASSMGKGDESKANGHWITFDRVAVLTNNPLVGFASVTAATLFQTKLSLYSSYVLGCAHSARGVAGCALLGHKKSI